MFRAYLYLAAAGVIWLIEGFLFSYYLGFAAWQVALLAIVYLALYTLALRVFVRSLRNYGGEGELSPWRAVSLAPMIVVVVGSFVSIPLVIAVAALGKVI
jgi:hypothetical protein